ncbi:MAG: pyridoxine 5'-phosphate synthase [Candidatus Omnitrophica bacterium]|nr:pyridoxine 5'-phosphate synthase [Candidatus Omnitrophota bacterium]
MRLGVNIDHIATVRQARRGAFPDPVEAARLCERAGAASIVCHLREDRRHIQDADVRRLRRLVKRLNLEMSAAPDIVKVALAVAPDQVTLVPERRQELTTEGGLDVRRMAGRLRRLARVFASRGVTVSLFIDPVAEQVRAAYDTGAPMIELHTGRYAEAASAAVRRKALEALQRSARQAAHFGLAVAAGHGLDYQNVRAVAAIPQIEELNIGFSIISRALFVGLGRAVRDMRRAMARR